MAGSPRYLTLLAQTADQAETSIEFTKPDEKEAWKNYDEAWMRLTLNQGAMELMDFSRHSLILLHLLTGTPIETLAQEGMSLHVRKNAGYAGAANADPWANFRMATLFGSTALAGCLIRLGDKYIRTVNLRADPNNDQVGEAITETIRDAIAYPLIGICLMEEAEAEAYYNAGD